MLAEEGADEAVGENRKALFEQAVKVHIADAQAAGCREEIDYDLLGERTAAVKHSPSWDDDVLYFVHRGLGPWRVFKEGRDVPELQFTITSRVETLNERFPVLRGIW